MSTQSTAIGLVRHSVTTWNEEKKIQGCRDTPLTPKGKEMAQVWGEELKSGGWEEIISSDLGRAVETARIINRELNLPTGSDHRLREQDWGDWTGRTIKELSTTDADRLQEEVEKGWLFRPPGGENRREVLARVLEAIAETSVRHPGKRILMVCHEGVIKCVLYHLTARRFLPGEPKLIKPYHLHLLSVINGKPELKALNHLPLHR